MTTRQYIGARYIPVFADPVEWDATKAYEYLTMVQHVGETYMSKQNVPIGAPLPDTSQGEESTEYWVHMSNWNAQVETYRQEVLQYNGRISTVENDLPIADFDSTNTVKKAIDGLQDQIGNGFDHANTVASAIAGLQGQNLIRPIVFADVASMKASDDLANGMIVMTAGFNSAGDGGAALYTITDTGTADEMSVIACGALFANFVQTSDYVSPSMFGAYGDGTHDDTDAIQFTLDNYKNVIFDTRTYKCNTIEIKNSDSIVDFNMSNFIVPDSNSVFLRCINEFDTIGFVVTSYTANSVKSFIQGNGLHRIVSDECVMPGRAYYRGGFAVYVKDDVMTSSLPYSMTECTIDKQSIDIGNVIVKNIASVQMENSSNETYVIRISGVHDFVIDDVNFDSAQYGGIEIAQCANVTVKNCNINMTNNVLANIYGVMVMDGCSNTVIEDCNITCAKWTCITTGTLHTNVDTVVRNCKLQNLSTNTVYDDHGNTVRSRIENCDITGVILIADGIVTGNVFHKQETGNNPGVTMMPWLGAYYNSSFKISNNKSTNSVKIGLTADVQDPLGTGAICKIISVVVSDNMVDPLLTLEAGDKYGFINELDWNELIIVNNTSIVDPQMIQMAKRCIVSNCRIVNHQRGYNPSYYPVIGYLTDIIMNNVTTDSIVAGGTQVNYGGELRRINFNTIQFTNCRFNGTNDMRCQSNNGPTLIDNCFIQTDVELTQAYLQYLYFNGRGANYCEVLKKPSEATYYTKAYPNDASWVTHN